jgi:hypothetical protein
VMAMCRAVHFINKSLHLCERGDFYAGENYW